MHPGLPQLGLDLFAKLEYLGTTPSQHARPQLEDRGLEAREAAGLHPPAQGAHLGVPGPGAHRPNPLLLHHGLETGLLEHRLEVAGRVDGAADGRRGLHQHGGPPGDGAGRGHGVVGAEDGEGVVVELDEAAWLEVAGGCH